MVVSTSMLWLRWYAHQAAAVTRGSPARVRLEPPPLLRYRLTPAEGRWLAFPSPDIAHSKSHGLKLPARRAAVEGIIVLNSGKFISEKKDTNCHETDPLSCTHKKNTSTIITCIVGFERDKSRSNQAESEIWIDLDYHGGSQP
ncbi:hypothetical protein BGZ63DRAFT_401620 [Mariannaea sp. PMI_226]|nr:hypothetical protein BGZ63DRAFT_401620 [Mariannaea sp. PMI_226]